MYEDKLDRLQRIRLEAVAQANQRLGPSPLPPAVAVTALLREAQRIERYIQHGTLTSEDVLDARGN